MTTIMITGATDGIGLATAQELAEQGHDLVLHGRNAEKLRAARQAVEGTRAGSVVGTLLADLADLAQVAGLATDQDAAHRPRRTDAERGIAALHLRRGRVGQIGPVPFAGVDHQHSPLARRVEHGAAGPDGGSQA